MWLSSRTAQGRRADIGNSSMIDVKISVLRQHLNTEYLIGQRVISKKSSLKILTWDELGQYRHKPNAGLM